MVTGNKILLPAQNLYERIKTNLLNENLLEPGDELHLF
jgi:hypothetical protein